VSKTSRVLLCRTCAGVVQAPEELARLAGEDTLCEPADGGGEWVLCQRCRARLMFRADFGTVDLGAEPSEATGPDLDRFLEAWQDAHGAGR